MGEHSGLPYSQVLDAEVGLLKESSMEVSLSDGEIVITPITAPEKTLKQLLSGITAENLHREIDFGPGTGNEVW